MIQTDTAVSILLAAADRAPRGTRQDALLRRIQRIYDTLGVVVPDTMGYEEWEDVIRVPESPVPPEGAPSLFNDFLGCGPFDAARQTDLQTLEAMLTEGP